MATCGVFRRYFTQACIAKYEIGLYYQILYKKLPYLISVTDPVYACS